MNEKSGAEAKQEYIAKMGVPLGTQYRFREHHFGGSGGGVAVGGGVSNFRHTPEALRWRSGFSRASPPARGGICATFRFAANRLA